jgi:hypothetical protein
MHQDTQFMYVQFGFCENTVPPNSRLETSLSPVELFARVDSQFFGQKTFIFPIRTAINWVCPIVGHAHTEPTVFIGKIQNFNA